MCPRTTPPQSIRDFKKNDVRNSTTRKGKQWTPSPHNKPQWRISFKKGNQHFITLGQREHYFNMLINTNCLVICLFASFLLQIINEQNLLQLGKIYSSYQRTGGVLLNRIQTWRLNFKDRFILCYCPVIHQRLVRCRKSDRNKARGHISENQ